MGYGQEEEMVILNDDHMHSSADPGPSNRNQVSHQSFDEIPVYYTRDLVLAAASETFSNSRTPDNNNTIPKKLPGLTLNITPSFVESAAETTDDTNDRPGRRRKIPPAHMNASFIKIGTWERIPKYEDHLVAKILYAKKKLVWEYIDQDDGVKRKIEFHWCRIQGLNADIQPSKPGILKIELSAAPSLHKELEHRPKRQTEWTVTEDFTGGQASSCRIHYLRFAPGKLDKPYSDMLKCDKKLQALSRNSFPTLPNPCFPPTDNFNCLDDFGFDYNAGQLGIHPNMAFGSLLPSMMHYSNDPHQYVQPHPHRPASAFNNMRGPTMPITGPGESSGNNYAFDSNNFHLGAFGNNQVMNQNREIFGGILTEATTVQSYHQTQNFATYYGQNNGALEHDPNLLQTGTRNCSIYRQHQNKRESPDCVLQQGALATYAPQANSGLLNGSEASSQSDFQNQFAKNISPPPRILDENLPQILVPPGSTEADSHQILGEEFDYPIPTEDEIREVLEFFE